MWAGGKLLLFYKDLSSDLSTHIRQLRGSCNPSMQTHMYTCKDRYGVAVASLTVVVNCTLDSLDQKHTVEYRFIKHVLVLAVQCHLCSSLQSRVSWFAHIAE